MYHGKLFGRKHRRPGGPQLPASPASRLAIFCGHAAVYVVEGFIYVAVSLAMGSLVFGLDLPPGRWGGVLLAALTAAVTSSGLGPAVGALAYRLVNINLVVNPVCFVLVLLSGANMPLEELPPLLRTVSYGLPLTHSIAAARRLAAGAGVTEVLPF